MSLQKTTGNILEIGDKVKINLQYLEWDVEENGGDGIEFTASGKNYLRYAREHPDEVYTVVDINPEYECCPYVLSGYMSDNTWESNHQVCEEDPEVRAEAMQAYMEDEWEKTGRIGTLESFEITMMMDKLSIEDRRKLVNVARAMFPDAAII